jgi:hypothetical protein
LAFFQKDKEDLEEISNELELADEDELVPYVHPCSALSNPLLQTLEPDCETEDRYFQTRQAFDKPN